MSRLLKSTLAALASLKITVAGLLLLTALTVWGTLYQADHGLFQAQERFYQSWWFLAWGFLPFPGAQTVMTVMFVNLAASMGHMAVRKRLTAGFLATHLGLAMMLAAGGVTFYWGHNANLSLEEGWSSNVAISSDDWELSLMPATDRARRMVTAMDARDLKPGRRIRIPDGGTTLRVEQFYRNCSASSESVATPPQSVSGNTVLHRLPVANEPHENYPGALLAIENEGRVVSRVLLWGGDMGPAVVDFGDGPRALGLRRQRLPLPATIELVDFKRELHPGTGMARSYSSEVLVRTSAEMKRKVLVAMNKPLRLHGFTFYQSSFGSAPGGREISTFAVVQNHGRLIPYIATGLTGAGMVLHFSGMLVARLRRAKHKEVRT